MDAPIISNTKISAPDVITTLYTSPSSGGGTIVTAFTVSNNSTASAYYKAYIYDSTGAVVDPVIPLKIVVRDRFDVGASIVNQVVPAGGTIRAENSTGDALNFYATGREQ
jgi:hypothetical protein